MSSTAPAPSRAPEGAALREAGETASASEGLIVRGLVKDYAGPGGLLRVLDGVDLEAGPGEALSIMGASGCGKSTLLFLLGAIESPSDGEVRLAGVDPHELDPDEQARFRRDEVGFVFQDHCLLPQCTALENVLTPTLPDPRPGDRDRAVELLDRVGLSARRDHLPAELSGGEKQRVAIARALVRRPGLLLCDEPTGNLDGEAAARVAELLVDRGAVGAGCIVVLVTHDPGLGARFDRGYRMERGRLKAA